MGGREFVTEGLSFDYIWPKIKNALLKHGIALSLEPKDVAAVRETDAMLYIILRSGLTLVWYKNEKKFDWWVPVEGDFYYA